MSSPDQAAAMQWADCSILQDSSDYDAASLKLFDACFGPGRYAKTAERLREGNYCLRDCSMLATHQGEVVAAVKLWPLLVGGVAGMVFVGPVAVDAAFRGSSLGLHLTKQCLTAAQQAGWRAALLVGDAPYFGRIGFEKVSASDFQMPGYVEPHRLLAKALQFDGLEGLSGDVTVPRDAKPEA